MPHEIIQVFYFQAAKALLSPEEILRHIPAETLDKIKLTDAKPKFKAFVLAHEGMSKPRIVGKGHANVMWPRKIISAIVDKLQAGTKFFYRHNSDSSHKDREPYGEVVAKGEREIDGKLHAYVIGYFPPEKWSIVEKVKSISGEYTTSVIKMASGAIDYMVDAIEETTGIALGADGDVSAFSGANEIGFVQAFNFQANEPPITRKEMTIDEALQQASLSDIARAMENRRIHPSQVGFTPDKIYGRRVKKKDGSVHWDGGDREYQKFFDETLGAELGESATKIDEMGKALAEFRTKALRFEHLPKIEKLAQDQKLPSQAIALAKARIGEYVPGEDENKSIVDYIERIKSDHEILVKSGYQTEAPKPQPPANGFPSFTTSDADAWVPK